MNFLQIRKYKKPDYTISALTVDGDYLCEVVEDQDRGLKDSDSLTHIQNVKVYGKTAIPTGLYEIDLTMSHKFQRVLPLFKDVKGFTGIRLHRGNTDEDSEGCLLPGENKIKGGVINSTHWEIEIIKLMLIAVKQNERIYWEII